MIRYYGIQKPLLTSLERSKLRGIAPTRRGGGAGVTRTYRTRPGNHPQWQSSRLESNCGLRGIDGQKRRAQELSRGRQVTKVCYPLVNFVFVCQNRARWGPWMRAASFWHRAFWAPPAHAQLSVSSCLPRSDNLGVGYFLLAMSSEPFAHRGNHLCH